MKIEIRDSRDIARQGEKNGRRWQIREQVGYIHLVDKPYPVEIRFSLDADQPPYPAGEYEISESTFFVGKFQRLEVGRLRLVPLKSAVRAAG